MERVTIGGGEESPADAPQPTETAAEETPQQEEVQQAERPEWLPDKFASGEDLAKAYRNLEKKQSSQQAEEQGLLTQDDFQKYSDEYQEKGELSDSTYEGLAKRGLSRELVDSYIQGQQMITNQQVQELYQVAGGEENYNSMVNWASQNLNQADLDAFNTAVGDNNLGIAKLAIQGLTTMWQQAGGDAEAGNQPKLLQGSTRPTAEGGYGSNYEMMQDMKDPRYKAGDAKFHAMVERRLAKTTL